MRKLFIILILATTLFIPTLHVEAKAKQTNLQIINQLCNKHHKKAKIVNHNDKKTDYTVLHRKGKPYIVVERIVSTSKGKHGVDKHGCYIAYNKYVKKGTKVYSYIIYSPKSNEPDDVLYVVDNQTYR